MNTRLQVQTKTTPTPSFMAVGRNLLNHPPREQAEPPLVPPILHEALPTFQAKLTIGQPNDQYEQEADRVADQVMRMPEPKIQRVCPKCEDKLQRQPMKDEEEEETLQAKTTSGQPPTVSSNLQNHITALQGGGKPLSQSERAFFEPRFGADFSQVRVHADSRAAETASAVNARAFTVGRDVVFGSGQYQPSASEGRHLLAHELVHTVQQRKRKWKSPITQPLSITGAVDRCLQRDNGRGRRFEVHSRGRRFEVSSPVLEETVRQGTVVTAAIVGRPLRRVELQLAESVFGRSINYSQVRVVESEILGYRGLPNTITVPVGFRINMERAAASWHDLPTERFIHEMVHVWQYQHGGTTYISDSLLSNTASLLRSGSRTGAYISNIVPGQSFFEYSAEQQAHIVTQYFWASLRLAHSETLSQSWRDRMEQIVRSHRPLIRQLQSVMPRTEAAQVESRLRDLMLPLRSEPVGTRSEEFPTVRPLLDIRFDIGL